MAQVLHVIEDFSNGQYKIFERLWARLAKTAYDAKVGIQQRGNHLIVGVVVVVVYR